MKVLKRNSRQKKPQKTPKGLKLWLRLNICLSQFVPPKSQALAVWWFFCRQLRGTGVFRRRLWINTWCLSQRGWMVPPTRLEGAPTAKLWFSAASLTEVIILLANAAFPGWNGDQSRGNTGQDSWSPLGWGLQTAPKPHKLSCSGCRDQEQPVGHSFVLRGHLERCCCCDLGVF